MQLNDNVVLVTGGASGIGLALAQRLLEAGSQVIVCGRHEAQLRAAADAHPGLVTRTCDLAHADERVALAEWVTREFPALNVLVNNAGIQHLRRSARRLCGRRHDRTGRGRRRNRVRLR